MRMLGKDDVDVLKNYVFQGFPDLKGRIAFRMFDPPDLSSVAEGGIWTLPGYDEYASRIEQECREQMDLPKDYDGEDMGKYFA